MCDCFIILQNILIGCNDLDITILSSNIQITKFNGITFIARYQDHSVRLEDGALLVRASGELLSIGR